MAFGVSPLFRRSSCEPSFLVGGSCIVLCDHPCGMIWLAHIMIAVIPSLSAEVLQEKPCSAIGKEMHNLTLKESAFVVQGAGEEYWGVKQRAPEWRKALFEGMQPMLCHPWRTTSFS